MKNKKRKNQLKIYFKHHFHFLLIPLLFFIGMVFFSIASHSSVSAQLGQSLCEQQGLISCSTGGTTVCSFDPTCGGSTAATSFCGDGTCNNGETLTTCQADCGSVNSSGGSGTSNTSSGSTNGTSNSSTGTSDNGSSSGISFGGSGTTCPAGQTYGYSFCNYPAGGFGGVCVSVPNACGTSTCSTDASCGFTSGPWQSGGPSSPYCGDTICDGGENPATCPQDCSGSCGDSFCNAVAGENYLTCPSDCQSGGTASSGSSSANGSGSSSGTTTTGSSSQPSNCSTCLSQGQAYSCTTNNTFFGLGNGTSCSATDQTSSGIVGFTTCTLCQSSTGTSSTGTSTSSSPSGFGNNQCSGCQAWNGSACVDNNGLCSSGQVCSQGACVTAPSSPGGTCFTCGTPCNGFPYCISTNVPCGDGSGSTQQECFTSPVSTPTPTAITFPPASTPSPTSGPIVTSAPSPTPSGSCNSSQDCSQGQICNNNSCVNPSGTPTPTSTSTTVTIQGHFVDSHGNDLTNDIGQDVSINNNPPTSENSVMYYANTLSPGTSYTVTATALQGYTISHSSCTNCTDHPLSGYTAGNSVTISLPNGGNYVDIYFMYTPGSQTPTSTPTTTQGITPTASPTLTPTPSPVPNCSSDTGRPDLCACTQNNTPNQCANTCVSDVGGSSAHCCPSGQTYCSQTTQCVSSASDCPTTTTSLTITSQLPGIGPIGGNTKSPVHPTRSAQIQIVDAQNNQVANVSGTVVFNGTDTYVGTLNLGSTISSGSYTVLIRLDNTLWKQVAGIQAIQVNTTNKTSSTPILITGDLNQDNTLDLLDYNIFINCLQNNSCNQHILADLNDDGKIDETDLNILLRGFGNRNGDGLGNSQTVNPTVTPTVTPALSSIACPATCQTQCPNGCMQGNTGPGCYQGNVNSGGAIWQVCQTLTPTPSLSGNTADCSSSTNKPDTCSCNVNLNQCQNLCGIDIGQSTSNPTSFHCCSNGKQYCDANGQCVSDPSQCQSISPTPIACSVPGQSCPVGTFCKPSISSSDPAGICVGDANTNILCNFCLSQGNKKYGCTTVTAATPAGTHSCSDTDISQRGDNNTGTVCITCR